MKQMKIACILISILCLIAWSQAAKPEAPTKLINRLAQTNALNIDAVITTQFRNAGRTRRNSGIRTAIQRPELEIYSVDHSAYFNH
jgi:outer membrane lipoprotein-sorting protein